MLKRNMVTFIIAFFALLKDCSILPIYLNIPLHFMVCLLAILADLAVFLYYGSLPDSKKNVLTYIVRFMSLVSGITVLWYNLSAVTLQFSHLLSQWIIEYPNLTCSLLRSETLSELIVLNFALIQFFKTWIVFNSLSFVNMNHEKVFRFVLATAVSVFIIHNTSVAWYAATLCPKTKVERMLNVHNLGVPKTEIKKAPPVFILHLLVTFIATALLKGLKYRNKRKERIVYPERRKFLESDPNLLPKHSHNYETPWESKIYTISEVVRPSKHCNSDNLVKYNSFPDIVKLCESKKSFDSDVFPNINVPEVNEIKRARTPLNVRDVSAVAERRLEYSENILMPPSCGGFHKNSGNETLLYISVKLLKYTFVV